MHPEQKLAKGEYNCINRFVYASNTRQLAIELDMNVLYHCKEIHTIRTMHGCGSVFTTMHVLHGKKHLVATGEYHFI